MERVCAEWVGGFFFFERSRLIFLRNAPVCVGYCESSGKRLFYTFLMGFGGMKTLACCCKLDGESLWAR